MFDLLNKPVSYMGKIGVITDLFTNEPGTKSYVVFKSAESIIRSVGKSDDEFIPFIPELVKEISIEEFTSDVEEKTRTACFLYDNNLKDGLKKFKAHRGEFVTTIVGIKEKEPYIVWFRNNTRMLIENAIGELKLVFHHGLFMKIETEAAISLAEEYYKTTGANVIAKLNEFSNNVLKGK